MYYIAEYGKGEERHIYRGLNDAPVTFKQKSDALAFAEKLAVNKLYTYKVWSTTQCPEGYCDICMDYSCPAQPIGGETC